MNMLDRSKVHPLLKRTLKLPRVLTAKIRLLPDFLIIGAQRCGTTSLQRYLIQHPCVVPAFRKEVHFFDKNLRKGIGWYKEHFPLLAHKYYRTAVLRRGFVTGEATAAYIFYPHAAKKILETVPHARLIVLLRNPIDRAYSHYQHESSLRFEHLSFEEAIKREPERLDGEREKILADENYDSYPYRHYSYLSRGVYVDQLESWTKLFSKEQILILRSEDFFADPATVFHQVVRFLDLPPVDLADYKPYNAREYTTMDAPTRRWLSRFFEPHNRRLYDFLGRNLHWEQ
jgi:hypothetical protein